MRATDYIFEVFGEKHVADKENKVHKVTESGDCHFVLENGKVFYNFYFFGENTIVNNFWLAKDWEEHCIKSI